jgi:hypothetical protein
VDKRRQLARSISGIVRELHGPMRLPGASPLNLGDLQPYEHELAALAERLADRDRPVRAEGLRLAGELVTNGGSPLYDHSRRRDVPKAIDTILAALEPR